MKIPFFKESGSVTFIGINEYAISETNPRVIDDGRARKFASDLKRCSYYETCATYGLNVERVFHDACSKIVSQRLQQTGFTPSSSRPSTPTHLLRYPSVNNGLPPATPTFSTLPSSNASIIPPVVSGTSPSHIFSNTYSKQDAVLRSTFSNGAELTAMTRTESFRDDPFKRVSAPNTFMVPPSPAPIIDTALPKDLPTPSSTPTTARKSRRKSNLFTPSKKAEVTRNGEVGSGRAIPIKQGYLYKKSNKALNKDWKKKYVSLGDDGRLIYHANLHDYMENSHGKDISLQYTTVKVPGMKPRGSRVVGSDPLTTDLNSLNLAPSSIPNQTGRSSLGGLNNNIKDKVMLTSYEALHESQVTNGLEKIETPNVKKRHRRMKSSGVKNADCEDSDGFELCIVSLDNKQWHFEASSQEERDDWVTAIEQQILFSLQGNESHKCRTKQTLPSDPKAINAIKNHIPGNTFCADCENTNPEWASINLGILLCIECSGIHRNLGSHISKVRSLDLDDWPAGPLSVMMSLGNEFVSSVWEGRTHSQQKPSPRSSREEKEKWIRSKYENKDFLANLLSKSPLHEQMVDCVCRGDVKGLVTLMANSTDSINAAINPQRDLRTLLHLASGLPSLACTQLLIWNNANVKVLDSEGRSCLYYAKSSGDKDVVDLLIQTGCPDGGSYDSSQPSTLPRRKGSISRKPEILDKLQASVI